MRHRDLTLPNFPLPRFLDRYPELPIQMVSPNAVLDSNLRLSTRLSGIRLY